MGTDEICSNYRKFEVWRLHCIKAWEEEFSEWSDLTSGDIYVYLMESRFVHERIAES